MSRWVAAAGPRFATRSSAPEIAGRSPVEILRAVGPLLYGPEWKAPTGRLLGVTDRTIRYWLAGQRNPPERIVRVLDRELWKRLRAITDHLGGRVG